MVVRSAVPRVASMPMARPQHTSADSERARHGVTAHGMGRRRFPLHVDVPLGTLADRARASLGRVCRRPVIPPLGVRMLEAVATPPTTFRLTPRPYQYEAVAALLAASARGVQCPLLVLPTGTGKTIVFALLVQRRRGRSLILAHRDELIQQAVDKLHL